MMRVAHHRNVIILFFNRTAGSYDRDVPIIW